MNPEIINIILNISLHLQQITGGLNKCQKQYSLIFPGEESENELLSSSLLSSSSQRMFSFSLTIPALLYLLC